MDHAITSLDSPLPTPRTTAPQNQPHHYTQQKMTQASNFLLAQAPSPQRSESATMNQDIQSTTPRSNDERPDTPSSNPQAPFPATNGHNPSTCGPKSDPEAEDVTQGAISRSSIFQGLSRFLHNVLVLGALQARERFEDEEVADGEKGDDVNSATEASAHVASSGDHVSDVTAVEGKIDETDLKGGIEESLPSEATGAKPSLPVSSKSSDDTTSNQQDTSESIERPDGTIIEQMPVVLETNLNPHITTNPNPQPDPLPPVAPQEPPYQPPTTTTQPLFQSFCNHSIFPEETESIDFEDLVHISSSADHCPARSSPSSQTSSPGSKMQHFDPDGFKKTHEAITGRYFRKLSPGTVSTESTEAVYQSYDPPLQTVAATRKPTFVQNLVRRISHQPMVVEDVGGVEENMVGNYGEEMEEDALAPFNRLERKVSV
ncbi:MAG: hypothetical protein Q9170_005744 [Blastenia crenularia]